MNATARIIRIATETRIPVTQNTMKSNASTAEVTLLFSETQDIVLKCAYVFVSLLGILGNSLVCCVILKIKRMRSTVNMLIMNLALADIVADISVYPYVFINVKATGLTGKHADRMCGITDGLTLFFCGALVSLLSLSVLSFSRYLVINHPLKRNWRLRRSHVKWTGLISWLISLALVIPSGLSFKYDAKHNICWRHWAPGVIPVPYFLATVLLAFVIPMSTLLFTYLSSIYSLWFKNAPRLTRSNSTNSVTMYRGRVVILLGLLILVYLFTWLPFGIHWFLSVALNYYSSTVEGQIKSTRGAKVTIFIALCSTLLDPIVYAFSNKHMRRSAISLIRGRSVNVIDTCGTELERDYRR